MSWIMVYLLFSLFVAVMGRNRRPGFLGWLVLSLFLTPLVGLAIFLVTQTTLVPAAPEGKRIALTPEVATARTHVETCPKCRRKLAHVDVEVDICPRCGPSHT